MATAEREHIRGLSAEEKERRRLAGISLTRRVEVARRFQLSRDDQARLDTTAADDPEIAAYNGYPEIQAEAMRDMQAAQETARRRAEGSLRAHMPTEAILGREELAPPRDDMMAPDELPYFGE